MRRLIMVILFALFSSMGWAVEGPSLEVGKTLFESTSLGSNGNSCATCHPGGKGLAEVTAYADSMLKEMINFCIRDALKGTMLTPEAQELEALLRYIRNLSKP